MAVARVRVHAVASTASCASVPGSTSQASSVDRSVLTEAVRLLRVVKSTATSLTPPGNSPFSISAAFRLASSSFSPNCAFSKRSASFISQVSGSET